MTDMQWIARALYKAAAELGNCPTVEHARQLSALVEAYNKNLPLSGANFRILIAIGKQIAVLGRQCAKDREHFGFTWHEVLTDAKRRRLIFLFFLFASLTSSCSCFQTV